MQHFKSFSSEFQVENFVSLILEEKLSKSEVVAGIESQNLDSETTRVLIQRLEFAYKRIVEPLDSTTKFLLLLFPFGVIHRLYKNDFFDLEKNRKAGYKRKVEEYYKYSFAGIIIDIMILVILVVFL